MSTNTNLISVGSTTPIPEQTFYASAAPSTTAGFSAGDVLYVTPQGTAEDSANATEEWRFDGTRWVKTPITQPLNVITTVQPTPTATGNTTNLNSTFKDADGDTWIVDANGDAIKAGSAGSAPTGQNVYFDTEDPATGTIFDTENPPITNNNALKEDSANTYYGIDGSVWTWNGTEYITKVYNFTTEQTNTFTATASQTAFTLSKSPIGQVYGYRNGVKLPTAWTWVGPAVTYIPANNGTKTIDAGDIISFEYEAY